MNVSRTDQLPVLITPRRLASWKAIADYFDCDERTAKRWERERGLPVHRVPGLKRSGVFAYTSELDSWMQSSAPAENPHSWGHNGELKANRGSVPTAAVDVQIPIAIEPASLPTQPASVRRVALRHWLPWTVNGVAVLVAAAALLVYSSPHAAPSKSANSRALSNVPQHVPSPGAEALYLRGRYYWNLRTADGLAKAIDAYNQAIVIDPSYAEAFAGLAEAYDLLPQFGRGDFDNSLRKAEQAADRAIALDPNLAAAHRAKAFALFYWDWDIAGSEAEFRRALALDPNSAQTHQWYAGTLQSRSDGAEAVRQIDEAVRIDPTSPAIAADAAFLHADFGDFRAGIKALKEIEQSQPTLASPVQFLRELDFDIGDFPAYIDDVRSFANITHAPDDLALAKAVAQGWARAGRTGLLEARAKALKAAFDHGTETGFQLGQTLLLLGHRDVALFYFNAALAQHGVQFVAIDDYPWAKKLSRDPGYAELFTQIRQRVHAAASNHPKQPQVAFELPL